MKSLPMKLLGGLTAQAFLDEYWQKKPLLVRNALQELETLLEPDELAGLALEDDVESRIVIERSPIDWELMHGPFDKGTFKDLPKSHWTLLIQALDHSVPDIADLLDQFNFIPNWRIDDVMASFAPNKGSVGPHYDNYDVFLIQGYGQRRWRIGQKCNSRTEILPSLPVRILKHFQPEEEWLLNPGDMLYLPPGVAHFGIAEGDCITYSVGFRAPSDIEILNDFVHYLSQTATDDNRYTDPDQQLQPNPGWISSETIARVTDIIQRAIVNPERISHWLASFLSQTKYDLNPEPPADDYSPSEVQDLLRNGFNIQREESSRFIYLGQPEHPEHFYINGQNHPFQPESAAMVYHLCKFRRYDSSAIVTLCQKADNLNLLTQLLNSGILYFDEEAASSEL